MDTSEKYIKMCEAAQEIQELRVNKNFDRNDFFHIIEWNEIDVDQNTKEEIKIDLRGDLVFDFTKKCKYIWLPRQDQLQEILMDDYDNRRDDLMMDFYDFYAENEGLEGFEYYQKFEIFWLTFAMQEKYNKVWDGKNEKWI